MNESTAQIGAKKEMHPSTAGFGNEKDLRGLDFGRAMSTGIAFASGGALLVGSLAGGLSGVIGGLVLGIVGFIIGSVQPKLHRG